MLAGRWYTLPMNRTLPIVLDLTEHEYECLAAEAKRQGKTPGDLARDLLRQKLNIGRALLTAEERERGLAGLKALAELRARLPEGETMDAVRLVRAGRRQLAKRSAR